MPNWRNMVAASGGGAPLGDYSVEVLADSPLGYWRMDTAGATYTNLGSLGATFNGTVIGSATKADTGLLGAGADPTNASLTLTGGVFDVAALAGSGQWPDAYQALTVEFWLKTNAFGIPDKVIFALQHDSNSAAAGRSLILKFSLTGLNATRFAAQRNAGVVSDNVTRHIVVTSAAGDPDVEPNIWYDGVDVSGSSVAGSSSTIETIDHRVVAGDVVTGSSQLTNPMTIQELAIYGTVLSGSRIVAHHTQGIAT